MTHENLLESSMHDFLFPFPSQCAVIPCFSSSPYCKKSLANHETFIFNLSNGKCTVNLYYYDTATHKHVKVPLS